MANPSVDWATGIITIPQSYLSNVTGTLYELNTDAFRLYLKLLEAEETGIVFGDTHSHNTEYTVAGVTYARKFEIISPYSVTFEDGQYSVRLVGSNNNIFDVESGILNQNQVQIIPGNAAGLIVKSIGTGLSTEEHDQLMALDTDSIDTVVDKMLKTINNKKSLVKTGSTWHLIIYDDDSVTPLFNKALKDKDGNDITDLAAGTLSEELKSSV